MEAKHIVRPAAFNIGMANVYFKVLSLWQAASKNK